jgi:hypothetical protein
MDAKQKMENVQNALDEYEAKIGLPPTDKPPCEEGELSSYLEMEKGEIAALTLQQCDEITMRIAQSIIYLRRLYNKETSRITWCENEITAYVCDKLNTVGGQYDKYDIKVRMIAKTDNYLDSLLKFRSYAQQRKDRLSDIANDLNGLKFVMVEIKKTKMREKNND